MTTAVKEVNIKDLFGNRVPQFIYEDEQCVVCNEELNPQALVHFLVVPRKIIPRLSYITEDEEKLLGHLLTVARKVAKDKGLHDNGFRVVINDGPDAGQTPDQICVQVLGGGQMGWHFCHMLLVARTIAIQKGLDATGYHVIVDEDPRAVRFKALHVFGRALHHMLGFGPGARL